MTPDLECFGFATFVCVFFLSFFHSHLSSRRGTVSGTVVGNSDGRPNDRNATDGGQETKLIVSK